MVMVDCAVAQPTITFRLKLPSEAKEDSYFFASSINSWNPNDKNYQFKKTSLGHFELQLKLHTQGIIAYKITQGSWDKVESNKYGVDINNRETNASAILKDTLIIIDVLAWKSDFQTMPKVSTASKNVKVLVDDFYLRKLDKKRKIWIYLPSDYSYSQKKYPVIYMHDGQNLFDEKQSAFGEWGVDECLDSSIQSYIVVGIENGLQDRLSEYSPYDFYYVSNDKDSTKIIGRGTEYLESLVYDLKPYIDRNYRTLSDVKHTSICGSSMGGLISFYAIMRYPTVFGAAGVFSPAFWTNMNDLKKEMETKSVDKDVNVFMITGGLEGERYVNNMFEISNLLSKQKVKRVHVEVIPDGRHNEKLWRTQFPKFVDSISK